MASGRVPNTRRSFLGCIGLRKLRGFLLGFNPGAYFGDAIVNESCSGQVKSLERHKRPSASSLPNIPLMS